MPLSELSLIDPRYLNREKTSSYFRAPLHDPLKTALLWNNLGQSFIQFWIFFFKYTQWNIHKHSPTPNFIRLKYQDFNPVHHWPCYHVTRNSARKLFSFFNVYLMSDLDCFFDQFLLLWSMESNLALHKIVASTSVVSTY